LLVNPGVAVATPQVFRARSGPFSRPARFDIPGDAAGLARALAGTANDLAAAARTLAPVIGEVLAALENLPGTLIARMSGSGATCFALYAGRADAKAAADRLRASSPPGWWVAAGGWHKPPEPAVVGLRGGC
jgi:4-diphosphocytidyl-2-C-methyl-D-erythritol kinase